MSSRERIRVAPPSVGKGLRLASAWEGAEGRLRGEWAPERLEADAAAGFDLQFRASATMVRVTGAGAEGRDEIDLREVGVVALPPGGIPELAREWLRTRFPFDPSLPPRVAGLQLPPDAGSEESLGWVASAVAGGFLPLSGDLPAGIGLRPIASPTPWIEGPGRRRRALLVTRFEADGAARGLLVSATCDPVAPRWQELPTRLLLLSAFTREALGAEAIRCAGEIEAGRFPDGPRELSGPWRLAVAAEDEPALVERLRRAAGKLAAGETRFLSRDGTACGEAPPSPPKTAFLFPGQGSQSPGMLADLCLAFPEVRRWFDQLDATFEPMGAEPSRWVFCPEGTAWEAGRRRHLESNDGGAPAVMAGSLGLFDLLRRFGIEPAGLAGHSSGENAALIASDAYIVSEDLIFRGIHDLVEMTGRPFSGSDRGRALAVSIRDRERFDEILGRFAGQAFLAMDNCPHQAVLFCLDAVVEEIAAQLTAGGALCLPLAFERPFHTPLFENALPHLRPLYDRAEIRNPKFPVWSCASLEPIAGDRETIIRRAMYQWSHPVRFRELVLKLHEEGFETFLEVGPSTNLRGFVQDTLRGPGINAISTDRRGESLAGFLQAIGRLFVLGHPVRLPGATEAPGRPVPPAAPEGPPPDHGTPALKRMLDGHLAIMRQALASQEMMTRAALGLPAIPGPERSPAALPGTRYPLLPDDAVPVEGRLAFELRWTLADLPLLADHTLGRTASFRRPGLRGIPVVPFTFSMELAAEAAARLTGGGVVTALEESRGYRWLAIDREALSLRVEAERRPEDGGVQVRIFELLEERRPMLAFESVVQVDERFPEAPPPREAPPDAPPEEWSAPNLYRICLFHGERFQAVKAIRHLHDRRLSADLETPTLEGFLRAASNPIFELSPVLLDCAGQLGAYAVAQNAYYIGLFPFRIESLEQFAPPPPERSPVRCIGSVRFDGEKNAMDFDYVSPEGRLLFRIRQKEQRCREYPRAFHLSVYWPEAGAHLSESWDAEGLPGIARIVREDVSEFLDTSWGIWSRALAHMTLDAPERAAYYTLPAAERSRWLCERNAAKDAVREWAKQRHGLELFPADIVLDGPPECLTIRCPELETVEALPSVAACTEAGRSIALLSETPMQLAFSIGERAPAGTGTRGFVRGEERLAITEALT